MGYKGKMTAIGSEDSLQPRSTSVSSHLITLSYSWHMSAAKARGTYDHSRQLPQRRKMMELWADLLDECLRGSP